MPENNSLAQYSTSVETQASTTKTPSRLVSSISELTPGTVAGLEQPQSELGTEAPAVQIYGAGKPRRIVIRAKIAYD